MRKKIKCIRSKLIVCFMLVFSIAITGCGTSRVPVWRIKSLAGNKTIESFEKKYEITPQITDVKKDWWSGASMGGLPSFNMMGYTGDATVTLKINDAVYHAVTKADIDDGIVFDDYEYEYVREKLVEDISDRLDIKCTGSFVKYVDTTSYGTGGDCENKLHFKFVNPSLFYIECHTVMYVGTTDCLDEMKIRQFTDEYSIDSGEAYLKINIVRFDDEETVSDGDKDFIYSKYILEDSHVTDYYEITKSSRYSTWEISHMGERIE